MISLILFILIGIELGMMHGLYLCLIIIGLVLNIIRWLLSVLKFAIKCFEE